MVATTYMYVTHTLPFGGAPTATISAAVAADRIAAPLLVANVALIRHSCSGSEALHGRTSRLSFPPWYSWAFTTCRQSLRPLIAPASCSRCSDDATELLPAAAAVCDEDKDEEGLMAAAAGSDVQCDSQSLAGSWRWQGWRQIGPC